MATRVEEVADNTVRLEVTVAREDLEHAVEHAAEDLAQTTKIPGFRKGKVPMQLLVARVGRDRLFREAVDSHVRGWFVRAASAERIRPVAEPQYEYDVPESTDEPFTFTATVQVQPKPQVADWTTLEVPDLKADVPEELVDQAVDNLRDSVAELVPVEGRPARTGDTVVLDLVSPSGEAQRDYVVELGSGRLLEEVERAVTGMAAGDSREISYDGDGRGQQLVNVTLKDIKEKVLPPADDELARTASEFDTLEELRADVEGRLREQIDDEVQTTFREVVADELAKASNVEVAPALVEARAASLARALARSLERRGIALDTYIQLSGQTPQQLEEQLRTQARVSLAREIVLETVADELGIDVPDEEVEELIREQATVEGTDPDELVAAAREAGEFERLRSDLRLRAALDRVASEVRRIPLETARAREQLWTPDKEQEKGAAPTKLWTPGSKERA